MSSFVVRALVPTVFAIASSGITGCYATASTAPIQPEPAGVTEVSSAPVSIETYPHTEYQGTTVYLYNDHWYYRDGANRWSYYRTEPAELQRQRHYVAPAPAARPVEPARREEPRREEPRREEPRRDERRDEHEAPPAVRVQ